MGKGDATSPSPTGRAEEVDAPGWLIHGFREDGRVSHLVGLLLVAISVAVASCWKRYGSLAAEVKAKSAQINRLECELQAELGDMVKGDDSIASLGFDFGFQIFSTE